MSIKPKFYLITESITENICLETLIGKNIQEIQHKYYFRIVNIFHSEEKCETLS